MVERKTHERDCSLVGYFISTNITRRYLRAINDLRFRLSSITLIVLDLAVTHGKIGPVAAGGVEIQGGKIWQVSRAAPLGEGV